MIDINDSLKNSWLLQLREDWRSANYYYFKNTLTAPQFELSASPNTLGSWQGGIKRTIRISMQLILKHPWEYVREVLYHEMTHQFVNEVLNMNDALAHGDAFQRVCREHGFDPSAAGRLDQWVKFRQGKEETSPSQKLINKIHKLLALAKSTNVHEAESAMTRAQELLLKHNLSILNEGVERNYKHKQIGKIGAKNPVKSIISTILNKFFFVETIWVYGYDQHKDKRGRILEVYGSQENLEMAEYVHEYLHNVSQQLWQGFKKENTIKGDKHRRTFIYGLLSGFHEKLELQAEIASISNALIWKGDPKLKEYYRRRNPRIKSKTVSYTKSCHDVYQSGIQHGKRLILKKGIHKKGTDGKGELEG